MGCLGWRWTCVGFALSDTRRLFHHDRFRGDSSFALLRALVVRRERQLLQIDRGAVLLYYVRQLVRKKHPARCRCGRVMIGVEDHVSTHRVGQCVDRSRRLSGPCVGVHPHLAEVVAEVRLHEGAGGRIERLAG
jgi:hypothetical protein